MRSLRRKAETKAQDELRIFYCGDIHGSDVCFRKFLNAGPHYDADVLILGGDITGKALVPIVRRADGTASARLYGQRRECANEGELEMLRRAISSLGFYPLEVSEEELEQLELDRQAVDDRFRDQMIQQIKAWIELADERLAGSGRECLIIPGNDDEYFIDDALSSGTYARNVEACVVELRNGIEVMSLSWSNATPWHSVREFPEDAISAKLYELSGQLREPASTIFNLHVPPYASGLDTVQKIDADFRPIFDNGIPVEIPCGSTAVRAAIEDMQPLLGLHGHVHESKNAAVIGRTTCINPGSDYASGRLHGVLVDAAPGSIKRHTFIEG
jgi:Icc-related predicted phosphoesterase